MKDWAIGIGVAASAIAFLVMVYVYPIITTIILTCIVVLYVWFSETMKEKAIGIIGLIVFATATYFSPILTIIILVIGFGLYVWYETVTAEKREERQALQKEREEEEKRLKLIEEQQLDKQISLTNDSFNTNLERDYQREFVTYWVGTTLGKFSIKNFTDDLYLEVYDKAKAKLLAEYSTAIFQSIYNAWYRDFHPEIPFMDIRNNAKKYAGGTSEKLSILELYTSYIAQEMLNMMTISKDLQAEIEGTPAGFYVDYRSVEYSDSYRERKMLKHGSRYILSGKIAFLLVSVFFLDREDMSIKGRESERRKTSDEIGSIVTDIESIKEEIIKNKDLYEFIQKSKQGSSELINFVEIEIGKLDAGDPEFLEKANAIIDAIDSELDD